MKSDMSTLHATTRTAVLGLTVLLATGCSVATAPRSMVPPGSPEPHLLYWVSERSATRRTVTLLPQQLERTGSVEAATEARLYVGGMASFTDGVGVFGSPNRLALVILAANDSIRPMLRDSRQLLLDVDGELYQTNPMPDPRFYTYGWTGLGHTETVIVPIDRDLLRLLAEAESVRGRVGHWLAFDVSRQVIDRLGDLLTAIPEGFGSGEREVALTPLHRATD